MALGSKTRLGVAPSLPGQASVPGVWTVPVWRETMIVQHSTWQRKLCPVLHYLDTSCIRHYRESHFRRLLSPIFPRNEIHSQMYSQCTLWGGPSFSLPSIVFIIRTHNYSNPHREVSLKKKKKNHRKSMLSANNGHRLLLIFSISTSPNQASVPVPRIKLVPCRSNNLSVRCSANKAFNTSPPLILDSSLPGLENPRLSFSHVGYFFLASFLQVSPLG